MTGRVRRKAPWALSLLVAATAVVAVGCGSGDSSSSETAAGGEATQEVKDLKVIASGADTYPYNGLLAVAQNKGWFKDEGLKVTIVSSEQGGGGVAQVLASGGADLAIGGGSASVPLALDDSADVTLLANWYPVNDFTWVTPDPNAKLEGATLGFTSPGSSTDLMLKGMHAARPDVDFKEVAVGSPGANWAAAKAGKITAAWELPPYTQQLQAEEGARILVSGEEVVGDIPADFVFANDDYIEGNPDVIKAFFRVCDKAFKYAQSDPAAAAKDLAGEIPIDAQYLQKAIEEYPKGYELKTSVEALENLSKILVDTKTIDAAVDWNQVLDQQYLPEDAQVELPASS